VLGKIFSRRLKWVQLFLVVLITGTLLIIFYAPYYLAYSDTPKRADAVVIFVGPEFEARKKEGHRLIDDGFADYFIIPAFDRVLQASTDGILTSVKKNQIDQQTSSEHSTLNENTHLEMLYAKPIMDEYGFKSAIFVSSPYHMRRIKMIAAKVFDGDDYNLCFVPANSGEFNKKIWLFSRDGRQWVLSEYAKIAWFLLYTKLAFLFVHGK